MGKDYPSNLPSRYESSKLSMVRGWWNGQSGALMRRMLPVIWPGVPVEAHMGFVSNASWNEDTALTPSRIAFHELGGYGTEGGPSELPVPNAVTTRGASNNWFRLHNDPRVRQLLGGRAATMNTFRRIDEQHWDIPLDDQIAIGIVNLYDALSSVIRRLRPGLAPARRDSLWAVALSFMAWSAGAGGASSHINKYASRLASVPEERRWEEFLRLIASAEDSRGSTHRNPAYSAMRTQQKLRVGRSLARANGGNVEWFGQIDERAEDIIAKKASRTRIEAIEDYVVDASRAVGDAALSTVQAVGGAAKTVGNAAEMVVDKPSAAIPIAIVVVAVAAIAYVVYTRKRGK